ncbi:MAG TPA: helix-turn-helix domain-containing protein, partial [Vicinamibacterales bacterium]
VILTEGDTIHPHHLQLSFRSVQSITPAVEVESSPWAQIDLSGSLSDATRRVVAEVERRKIEQALREARGNQGLAAERLQISYKALLAKLKEHRIDV